MAATIGLSNLVMALKDGSATEAQPLARFAGLELRDVAEAFPFAFLISDRSGIVRDANRVGARLFGFDQEHLIGKDVADLVPARYRATVRTALSATEEDRTAVTWEQEVELPDGGSTAVEASVVHIQDPRTPLVAWFFSDIRDRVAVDRRLRAMTQHLELRVRERTDGLEAERARLAALMRQIPAGLVIVDSTAQVVTANDEALRILHHENPEDVDIAQFASLSRRMDGSKYAAHDWPVFRSLAGEAVTGERIELKHGTSGSLVLDVSSAPVHDQAGRMIGAVCIFSDITVRERRERAEREFVTNAAHELQTPLAALVSAVEVLVGGAKDLPERDLFLEHVRRESERLTRLIRALLTLARAEIGADAPTIGIVPLRPVLEAVARELKPAPGVSLSISCPEDLAAVANEDLLHQAISNIAENAAKYTAAGKILIDARRSRDTAEIAITDTGPGIPPAERPLVFERFHRSPGGTGSGLGLAIVRAVVQALDGEVELDSELGSGTTVRIKLPHVTALVET